MKNIPNVIRCENRIRRQAECVKRKDHFLRISGNDGLAALNSRPEDYDLAGAKDGKIGVIGFGIQERTTFAPHGFQAIIRTEKRIPTSHGHNVYHTAR
jgi:hypothetical protein